MLDTPEFMDSEPPETGSIDALISLFQDLSERCNADEFLLFRIRGRKRILVPVLDGTRAQTPRSTPSLPADMPDDFARRVASSICVFWWDRTDGPLSQCLGTSRWAKRVQINTRNAGLALPIAAGDAGQGLAVFMGTHLEANEDRVTEIHARCHALFRELPEVTPEREESALPAMSRREMQCLKLTANGLTSEDIAEELGLSAHTANQYLANAAQKLNATNRIHAVAKALREGLIE